MRPSALLYSKNLHQFCLSSSMTLQSVGIRMFLSFGSMMHMNRFLLGFEHAALPDIALAKGWVKAEFSHEDHGLSKRGCYTCLRFGLNFAWLFRKCVSGLPKIATISWFRWNSHLREDWCGYSGPKVSGYRGRFWCCRSRTLHLGRWHLSRGRMPMMFCRSRMIESECHCIHWISSTC